MLSSPLRRMVQRWKFPPAGDDGDSVSWNDVKTMNIHASGLVTGDLLRVVTGDSSEVIFKAETDAEVTVNYSMAGLGFAD